MRVILLAVCFLASCQGPDPAEQATYDAIASEYWGYVESDPALTAEEKDIRGDTLDRWADAIDRPRVTGGDR